MLTFFTALNAHANCEEILERRKEVIEYARHIHKTNPEFYKSREVRIEQERLKKIRLKTSSQPQEMIADWLEVLEKTHGSAMGSERVKEKIEEYYFRKYIIKAEEIPESYYETQKKIAREQGNGNITLTKKAKQNLAEILIKDQKESLKKWLDYLLSRDANYPFWKKYWSFNSLLKMGAFDIGKAQFQKRSKGQVALFPELNQEALSKVFEQVSLEKTEDYNFAKKYALEFNQIRLAELKIQDELTKVEGKWIKYPKGSDETKLVESLENKSTGWCTAGKETAKAQLSRGDFHVFYSFDEQGNPTIPRVAIRFEDYKIVEVRGRDKNQNLDPKIAGSNIVEEKLKEFGNEGDQYQKRSSNMKLLTLIEKKNEEKQALTKAELRFLYERDHPIEGFGYVRDPRIKEIIAKRNIKNDLAFALDVDASRISISNQEALFGGNIFFHYGDLDLGDVDLSPFINANVLTLPNNIGGDLNLSGLRSASGLKLPDHVGGNLILTKLDQTDRLKLPDYVGGAVSLYSLKSAEGLKLPDHIGGTLNLEFLKSAKGLKLPNHMGGSLWLNSLTSAEGLKFPEYIGGSICLHSLTSAEGLKFPEYIRGSLWLNSLTSAEGLKFPDHISGDLHLRSLKSAQGIKFPNRIGGSLFLDWLKSAEGLKLPDYIGESLTLLSLSSPEGLNLPDQIGRDLDLRSLTRAEGVKLPNRIGRDFDLRSLTSGKKLKLPDYVGGDFRMYSLKQAEELNLPKYIGENLDLYYLAQADALQLPEYIGGELRMNHLMTTDVLKLPHTVGKNIYVKKQIKVILPPDFKAAIVYTAD